MIGEEAELTWERPRLSKEYFSAEKGFERILNRPADFYDKRGIATLLGRRVMAVNADRHEVILSDGSTIGYAFAPS